MPDATSSNDIRYLLADNNTSSITADDIYRELERQSKALQDINSSLNDIYSNISSNRYRQSSVVYGVSGSSGNDTGNRERRGAQYSRDGGYTSGPSRNTSERSSMKDRMDSQKMMNDLKSGLNKTLDGFLDNFEKELTKGLSGMSLEDRIKGHLNKFADSLGVQVEEIPQVLGSTFGDYINEFAKESDRAFAKFLNSAMSSYGQTNDTIERSMSSRFQNFAKNVHDRYARMKGEDFKGEETFTGWTNREAQNTVGSKDKYKGEYGRFGDQAFTGSNGKYDYSKYSGLTAIRIENAAVQIMNMNQTNAPNFPGEAEGPYNRGEVVDVEDILDSNETTALVKSGVKAASNVMGGAGTTELAEVGTTAVSTIAEAGGGAAEAITGAAGGIASAAGSIAGAALPIIGPIASLGLAIFQLTPAYEELKEEFESWRSMRKKWAKMFETEEISEIDNATQRLIDDVETIVREPFEILEEAAQAVYDVWDAELRTINGTQGYTKSDLQDLMSNYAYRLEQEGLTSVVSSADITENLAKVLEAGLSGSAAEEFAYIATVLNAAIPTQDFFDYADTYVSLAGNMIAQGYSEGEALNYANEQLELFASNVLYASRELTGGFTTGLQSASDIFQQSVQIAQTAGATNVAEISSVLTAVAAVTGSIAPDLATSMTDLIYQAAVGGNSSELVALRSLAGINASNTEFLNALINDPQSVFVTMFTNLDKLINTSNDNYMEVAESLSTIFGISTDALRRIDFNYLAEAISNMDVSSASLSENIALLASGETTTSKEQLKMEQINQYMIEEGLAYVLDNEAARAIQQHMWDEQIADELMEATYGIELVGESKENQVKTRNTIGNIARLLTRTERKQANRTYTGEITEALEYDVTDVLEAGKVGEGNAQDLYNLTTRGVDLNLTPDLVELLTGHESAYSSVNSSIRNSDYFNYINGAGSGGTSRDQGLVFGNTATGYKSISSMYSWGTNVGKSTVEALGTTATGYPVTRTSSSTAQTNSAVAKNIEKMLSSSYIEDIIESGGNYSDWVESARKFGITDLSATLKDLGYNETEVESYFQDFVTDYAVEENARYYAREELFWDNMEEYTLTMIDWLDQIYTFMDEQIYQDALTDKIYQEALMDNIYQDALNDKLYETSFKKDSMYNYLKTFYDNWYDYIYQHNAYNNAYDYSNVASIQSKEKTGSQDAVYALAEELTKNTVDLLDPTMQTNALLAQILIVVNAIMQSENASTTATSLTDTLSGLALGLFNTSST